MPRNWGAIGQQIDAFAWPSWSPDDGSSLEADEILTIEAEPVNPSELKNRIRNSGGSIIISTNSLPARIARDHWYFFSVQESRDGSQVKITENNYLLYGGIGLIALVALGIFARN